jgi:hypothetical protein
MAHIRDWINELISELKAPWNRFNPPRVVRWLCLIAVSIVAFKTVDILKLWMSRHYPGHVPDGFWDVIAGISVGLAATRFTRLDSPGRPDLRAVTLRLLPHATRTIFRSERQCVFLLARAITSTDPPSLQFIDRDDRKVLARYVSKFAVSRIITDYDQELILAVIQAAGASEPDEWLPLIQMLAQKATSPYIQEAASKMAVDLQQQIDGGSERNRLVRASLPANATLLRVPDTADGETEQLVRGSARDGE